MKNSLHYFKTNDGLSIRYCIRSEHGAGKSGSVVLLGGRSEFIEKYHETIGDLVTRRFHVYCLDWRGQGLSSRMAENPHKGYVETFDDYLNDLSVFMEKIVFPVASRPVIILAHSMGGHIALRYLHHHPVGIDAAVLLSPMIDIKTAPLPPSWMRFLVRLAVKMGYGGKYAAGSGDYPPGGRKFENNRLTSDRRRFADTYLKIRNNPDLALGGATYKWLDAAFDSIDILKTSGYVGRIDIPVLIAASGKEGVVSRSAQQKICRSLPMCSFVEVVDARHEILRERNHVRSAFWDVFDTFVQDQVRNK